MIASWMLTAVVFSACAAIAWPVLAPLAQRIARAARDGAILARTQSRCRRWRSSRTRSRAGWVET